MKYFEIYDDVTNKTLHIKAENLESAEGVADTLDWDSEQDGTFVDVTDAIDNYVE